MKKICFLFTLGCLFSTCVFAENTKEEVFTGRVTGNKVHIRIGADAQSSIVKQVNKNDLVLVMGEENDFYAIAPAYDVKAYVFRSYVIDNVVEANRVNIRLYPSTDAPVVGQLQQGERVIGSVYEKNHKWMEITPPAKVKFYISKDYVQYAGDKNFLAKMEKRKDEVNKLLNSAYYITQEECKKSFNEMAPENAIAQFEAIIQGYNDFPEAVQQAKEGLALLQDNYLQKKIAYLEAKAELNQEEKEHLLQQVSAFSLKEKTEKKINEIVKNKEENPISEKMRLWQEIEDTLYTTWNSFHSDKTKEDFYKEQLANALVIKGKIEAYVVSIKNKPGDYILQKNGKCIGYLYSTQVDLEKFTNAEVTLKVSPRPNNNFAYPAYFVNQVH